MGTQIVKLAMGLHHCLALTKEGDVFTWGENKYW